MRHGVLRNNKGIITHDVVQRLQRQSPFGRVMDRESWKKKAGGTTPPGVLHAIDRIAKSCAVPDEKAKD